MRFSAWPRLILLLALSPLLAPNAQPQQAQPLAGLAHVAIRVHDLAASIAFYRSLGFEQAFDMRHGDVPYQSFIKINDHQFIELYSVSDRDPQPGFLHLCFESNDIEELHEDYVSHGLTPISVRKAGAGNLLFTMPGPMQPIGPDGKPIPQNIEYTQYMPGSLHSKDAGQHLGADRIADRLLAVSLATVDPEAARNFYINQLSFKPLPGDQMAMHLPGNSGDEVRIVPASLGMHARIALQSSSLGRAARHLSREHIKTKKADETLSFSDPDGNEITVQLR